MLSAAKHLALREGPDPSAEFILSGVKDSG